MKIELMGVVYRHLIFSVENSEGHSAPARVYVEPYGKYAGCHPDLRVWKEEALREVVPAAAKFVDSSYAHALPCRTADFSLEGVPLQFSANETVTLNNLKRFSVATIPWVAWVQTSEYFAERQAEFWKYVQAERQGDLWRCRKEVR